MNIQIYMNSAGHNREREVLRCMHDGIMSVEIPDDKVKADMLKSMSKDLGRKRKVEYTYEPTYQKADVSVFLGSWKPDRTRSWHETRTDLATKSKCFICIETPLLGRKMFEKDSYHRVGINGFLNRAAYWGEDKDYPDDRLKKLGYEYKGWKKPKELGDTIVVALQLAGDASLRGNDINEWCIDTIHQLRKYTDKPIEVRTHPGVSEKGMGNHDELARYFMFQYGNIQGVKFVNGKDVPWEEHLKKAYAVVAYSSGLSIDAVAQGVPVIACDEGNFAWQVAEKKLSNINNIELASEQQVYQWLANLAYMQWSPEEMENGKCWQHLKPTVEKILLLEEEKRANESS